MTLSPPSPIRSKEPCWHFAYYSGCGNFFLIAFDPEGLNAQLTQKERAALTNSTKEIVDGLVFLGGSCDMHYYNRDGTRASMCGNGLRCLGHFASQQGFPSPFTIQTDVGERTVHILSPNEIATDMGPMQETQAIEIEGKTVYFTDTGVPHALFVRTALPKGPIEEEARLFRFHKAFGSGGANISYATFTKHEKGTSVFLRTYERGVERETGACGTGACAAASILHHHFGCSFPFTIHFASREQGVVSLRDNRLTLTASCEYKGSYSLPNPFMCHIAW